jgi:hypothetical protein
VLGITATDSEILRCNPPGLRLVGIASLRMGEALAIRAKMVRPPAAGTRQAA